MGSLSQLYLSLIKAKLSRSLKYSIHSYILCSIEGSIEERQNCAKCQQKVYTNAKEKKLYTVSSKRFSLAH